MSLSCTCVAGKEYEAHCMLTWAPGGGRCHCRGQLLLLCAHLSKAPLCSSLQHQIDHYCLRSPAKDVAPGANSAICDRSTLLNVDVRFSSSHELVLS